MAQSPSNGSTTRPSGNAWRIVLLSVAVNFALLLTYESARLSSQVPGLWPWSENLITSNATPTKPASQDVTLTGKSDMQQIGPPPKQALQLTTAARSSEQSELFAAVAAPNAGSETGEEPSMSVAASVEKQAMAPMLTKDGRTGNLRIGQFRSMTMEGDMEQCLDTGYAMVQDIGLDTDAVDVLAATDSITIAKICAANGSVVITCRNNSIVISPRRAKPNDSCQST